MTDEETLKWYIDEVREAIRLDWAELASKKLDADRRQAIREHLGMCHSALKDLLDRLDGLPKGQKPVELQLRIAIQSRDHRGLTQQFLRLHTR